MIMGDHKLTRTVHSQSVCLAHISKIHNTVFDLITTHIPIREQSSYSIVLRE